MTWLWPLIISEKSWPCTGEDSDPQIDLYGITYVSWRTHALSLPSYGIKTRSDREDEWRWSREGSVCNWSIWLHSFMARQVLAPTWLHCQSHSSWPKLVYTLTHTHSKLSHFIYQPLIFFFFFFFANILHLGFQLFIHHHFFIITVNPV